MLNLSKKNKSPAQTPNFINLYIKIPSNSPITRKKNLLNTFCGEFHPPVVNFSPHSW
jgi:hypothetical protein